MFLEELDIDVPEALIAQTPAEPRDHCRLMYLPVEGKPRHCMFHDLAEFLLPGDTLVLNDSRVLPARLAARRATGGRVELLFLRPAPSGMEGTEETGREVWEALARPSQRLHPGERLTLRGGQQVTLLEPIGEGRWLVQGPADLSLVTIMEGEGLLPLPPYIKAYPGEPSSYQTVYASAPGSSAAPTAGLHFTAGLLDGLAARGVGSARVTLHIGLDTFQPIREHRVEHHRIHRETYNVTPEALRAILDARAAGGRIVAVGTTAARVLETLARDGLLDAAQPARAVSGSTDIFITPGHTFRAVDMLLTNLHLPRSTVLLMTMAFAGIDRIRSAYAEAVDRKYRFFSFGDAMLIEPASADAGEGGDGT